MTSIGIDLGTTNSVIAYRNAVGTVVVISDGVSDKMIPSIVSFGKSIRTFGSVAKKGLIKDPKNTVYGVKRLIGKNCSDEAVRKEIEKLPYDVEDVNGVVTICVNYLGTRKKFKPVEISGMLLGYLKDMAEAVVGKISGAVITVPAYFNDGQRLLTREAATLAGLNVLSLINESTAAALAYRMEKIEQEDMTVLVFDLGGGMFDVTLMELQEGNTVEVIAAGGDTHLGGEDFDARIVRFAAEQFQKQFGKDISDYPKSLQRLREKVVSEKHLLSSAMSVSVHVPALFDGDDFEFEMTRDTFEELCKDLFVRIMAAIDKVVRDGRNKNKLYGDVRKVLLVGGSSRIPKLVHLLSRRFGEDCVLRDTDGDEAVAKGAAVFAAKLSKPELATICTLHDVTPLSLGVGMADDTVKMLIKRNTSVPTRAFDRFVTSYDFQTEVQFPIFQGEDSFCRESNLLASFSLKDLSPRPAGEEQFEVTFEVSAENVLTATAVVLGSDPPKSQAITVNKRQGAIDPNERQEMMKCARIMKAEGDAEGARTSARFNLEKRFRDALEDAKAANRADVIDELNKGLKWVQENIDEDEQEYLERHEVLKKILKDVGIPSTGKICIPSNSVDEDNSPNLEGPVRPKKRVKVEGSVSPTD